MSQRINFENSLIVGIDVHKRSHTAVIETPFCQQLESLEFENTIEGFCLLQQMINKYSKDKKVIYGVEDVNGNGYQLTQYLNTISDQIFHVPSNYTKKERENDIHQEKNDVKDAERVARVILTKSDKLPKAIITDKTKEANELGKRVRDYEDVVQQIKKIKQQLHVVLFELFGMNYREEVTYKNIFCKRARMEWKKLLQDETGYDSKRCEMKLTQLDYTEAEQKLLKEGLEELSEKIEELQILQSIPGCGVIIASKILSQIKDIDRFSKASKLARYSGLAPVGHISGGKGRYHTDRRGNRRLNSAFYQLAFCQIGKNGSEESKTYYEKKKKEGKSKMHSLRCLRRRFVDIVFAMLKNKTKYHRNSLD